MEPNETIRPMTLEQLEAYRKSKPIDDQKAIERAQEVNNEQLARDFELLMSAEKDIITTIPEVNFVQVFLPFFAGDENNLYNVDLSNWLTVAGSPYLPVNVADAQGNILYQVPAIVSSKALSPKPHDPRESIFELLMTANQMYVASPRLGASYFREHLGKVHDNSVDSSIDIDAIRSWNAIFTRYGRKPITIKGLESELNPSAANEEKQSPTQGLAFDLDPI